MIRPPGAGIDDAQHLFQRLVEAAGDAGDHAVGLAQVTIEAAKLLRSWLIRRWTSRFR
jgi:hypothetical protein